MLATTVDFLKESGQVFLVMTGPPLRCHPWHLSANANIVFALPLRLNHFPRKSHSLRRIYVRGSSPFLLGYEKHPNYLGRAFYNTCAEVNNKFCIFIKTVINVVFMKNIPWQGYWFLKAFQNAELPEYAVPCRRCLSEDVDIF